MIKLRVKKFLSTNNNDTKTYENIRKITTGQRDNYAIGCLLNCPYVKESYKMIGIDLSKQQA